MRASISVFCCCDVMDQRRAGRQRLVERHDRRLGGDLDRDLFGEIFGLGSGVGDHRGDRLADVGDALMGEDWLRNRDIIGAIEARTDRFDIAENSRGDDCHVWRRVHGEDAAARDRTAHEAQYAGARRQIGGIAGAALQQNRVFVARQWTPDPPHRVIAWSKARPTIARTRSRRYRALA